MEFKLRKVGPADWPYWLRLHHEGYKDNVIKTYGDWVEERQDDFARKEFDTPHDGQFVVTVDGVDAGYLSFDWKDDSLYLCNIVVDAPYRGKGLARAVIDHVVAMATVRGMPTTLRTMTSNTARGLYEKLGFVVYDEKENHFYLRRDYKEMECCGEGCASCG